MCVVAVAVSAPAWARPYQPADSRADAAIALVAQSSLGFALLALQQTFGPPITLPVRTASSMLAVAALGCGTLLAYLGLVGGSIAVPMWLHRCYRNLPALGSRGHLSPAWAAACWFVPLVNLVLPLVAVRDVFIASVSDRAGGQRLVIAWWICWTAALTLRLGGGFLPLRGWGELLTDGLMCVAGLLAIVTVRLVTVGQRRRATALR